MGIVGGEGRAWRWNGHGKERCGSPSGGGGLRRASARLGQRLPPVQVALSVHFELSERVPQGAYTPSIFALKKGRSTGTRVPCIHI